MKGNEHTHTFAQSHALRLSDTYSVLRPRASDSGHVVDANRMEQRLQQWRKASHTVISFTTAIYMTRNTNGSSERLRE